MAFEGSRIKWAHQQSYIKWLMRFWPFYSCLNKIRLWNGYSCEEFWYSPPCWTVLDTSALKWYTELGGGAEYIYKLQGLKEDNSKDRHRWGWHAYEINQQNGVTTALNLNTLSRWTSSVILSAPQCLILLWNRMQKIPRLYLKSRSKSLPIKILPPTQTLQGLSSQLCISFLWC